MWMSSFFCSCGPGLGILLCFWLQGLHSALRVPILAVLGQGGGDNAMLWANLMLLPQRSMISRSGALSPDHIYLLLSQAVGRGTELHRI